jgi:LuxR family maltose regulon positive regulatory protein
MITTLFASGVMSLPLARLSVNALGGRLWNSCLPIVCHLKPLETMLVALLNELSHLDRPALLVLDDVQVIDSPQVIASLTFFLEHLPSSFHLMLLTRGDPPFSLVRLHARNEVLDLYPPALRFTLEETRAFFAQELSFPLSQKVLRQIDERLDG